MPSRFIGLVFGVSSDAVLEVAFYDAGLEESRVAGVRQQAGCTRSNDGGRDFRAAWTDPHQRPHLAHTGVLCPHRRRVCTNNIVDSSNNIVSFKVRMIWYGSNTESEVHSQRG